MRLATAASIAVFIPVIMTTVSPVLRAEARWSGNPTVTVVGPGDGLSAVVEAVEFWNRQLADIRSPLKLGSVNQASTEVPAEYLRQLSVAVQRQTSHPSVPASVASIPGHIIVALSTNDFVSFAASIGSGKVLIGIRSLREPTMALPNLARNLIAHELGHALGLRHNGDRTTLMCGRPAPCRPQDYADSVKRFFPLTAADRKILLRLYPPVLEKTRRSGKIHRVGMLWTGGAFLSSPLFDSFLDGLADAGYIEGRNISFTHRWSESRHDDLRQLADELVRLKVDVLVAESTPAINAVKHATRTIPTVVLSVGDPVDGQLVASLARPGGNITGVSGRILDLRGKLLQLLKDATPTASSFAVMGVPAAIDLSRHEMEAAARALSVRLLFVVVTTAEELEHAFEVAAKARVDGALMLPAPLFAFNERRIAELALQHRLSSIFWRSRFPEVGGLMAYGPDLTLLFRRGGALAARILQGVKPADLPVEQADRFRLVLNLKTARALGLTIPPALQLQADRIIE